MAEPQNRHEFQVVIEGVELPEETVERLDAAIRKAVTGELATASFEDAQRLVERPLGPLGGGLVGLYLAPETE